MNPFDNAGLHLLNQFAGHLPVIDPIMKFCAQYILEVYMVCFVIAWFALPKQETEKRHALVVSVIGGVIGLLINLAIGGIYFRKRPFVAIPNQVHHIVPHPNDASFPSDHASGAFGFTFGAWGKTAKWVYRVFLLLAILVSIARVYVGDHWPTDVIGGLVVGMFSGWLSKRLSRLIRPITNLGLRIFRFGPYAKPKHR